VVDTSLFYPGAFEKNRQIKQFVHISCFEDKSKNISGFLRSVKALSEIRQDFRCLLVGNGPDWYDMKTYAGFLRIPDELVQFPGVLNGADLAETIRNSDFSVLSSRYETFGTVVVESLSCGVPVVSTAVGISTEVINKQNGILVPVADENEMTSALNQMLDSSDSYNRNDISNGVSGRFDRTTIAKQLVDLYREVKRER
jgi:glycosyltransferase involved in cell wall biosynthesis